MTARYHKTKLPDGTTRDTHRLMMERHLGRRLLRSEHVHHINGNPRDNRIENLEVMSPAEHARLHFAGIKLPAEARAKIKEGIRAAKERRAQEQAA